MDSETRSYRTGDREVVLDLTRDAAAYVADKGDGLLHLFVPHATAGIAILETARAATTTSSRRSATCSRPMIVGDTGTAAPATAART